MAKKDKYSSEFDTGTKAYGQEDGTAALQQRVSGLSSRASTQIDNSPLVALGAGAALGAVLAAVLPISAKEREVLEPLGRKLNEKGTDAIDRSRTMAKQKFDEMAGDKVREFLGGGASSSSASA